MNSSPACGQRQVGVRRVPCDLFGNVFGSEEAHFRSGQRAGLARVEFRNSMSELGASRAMHNVFSPNAPSFLSVSGQHCAAQT